MDVSDLAVDEADEVVEVEFGELDCTQPLNNNPLNIHAQANQRYVTIPEYPYFVQINSVG